MKASISNRANIALAIAGAFLLFVLLSSAGPAAFLAKSLGPVGANCLIAAIVMLGLLIILDRVVVKRLRGFGKSVEMTSSRNADLRLRLSVSDRDELGRFSRNFNILLARIHIVVFQLKNIAARGVEIGEELASGSEEIAASLEESARTVESIGGNGRALAERAISARSSRTHSRTVLSATVAPCNSMSAIAWTGANTPAFPRFPKNQGLNGAAVREGRDVIVQDVTKDSRYLTTFGSTRAEAIFIVATTAKQTVGTIDVESEQINAFTAEDEDFLRNCADALRPLWLPAT